MHRLLLFLLTSTLASYSLAIDSAPNLARVLRDKKYILCLSGGGTKTVLEVLNPRGENIPLIWKNSVQQTITVDPSNVHKIGTKQLKNVLRELFDVCLEDEGGHRRKIKNVLEKCILIAAISGLQAEKTLEILKNIGFKRDQIHLYNDATIFLLLPHEKFIVLISGTGSIGLARNKNQVFRAGGLGYILGDEGSGFHIGKMLLRRLLENLQTDVSDPCFLGPKSCHVGNEALQGLMKYFPVKEIHALKTLSVSLYKNPTNIASLSKHVFSAAEEQNPVAIDILKEAFKSLTDLYATLWGNIGSPTEEIAVYLNGGIFENKQSLDLLKTAVQSRKDIITNPRFIPATHENHVTYVVRKLLSTKI